MFIIVAFAAWMIEGRLQDGGFQSWTFATAMSDSTATTSSTASTSIDWIFTGGLLLVGAIIFIAAQRAIAAVDDWQTVSPIT
jgi:hypothetical protein